MAKHISARRVHNVSISGALQEFIALIDNNMGYGRKAIRIYEEFDDIVALTERLSPPVKALFDSSIITLTISPITNIKDVYPDINVIFKWLVKNENKFNDTALDNVIYRELLLTIIKIEEQVKKINKR